MTKEIKKSLENLKPQSKRTKEEQREIAKKGGIASGIARREGKLFKGLLEGFLKNPEQDESKIDDAIDNANIQTANKEEITNAVIMAASIIRKAKDGDLKAFELVRDTIGEKPTDKVENTGSPQTVINQPLTKEEKQEMSNLIIKGINGESKS